jgi:hypothetical protein
MNIQNSIYGIIHHFSDWLDVRSRIAILQMDGTLEKHNDAVNAIQLQISKLERCKKTSANLPKMIGEQSILKTVQSSLEEIATSRQ